ncbi:MAG TPA: hypothetical protein VFV38_18160 [Ktedonobacteraceae bacterium]|nr:hypothetical protein [Ktedonobacteraceae bacterium]
MSEAEPNKQPSRQILIPLEWHVPDSLRNAYADTVTAQPRRHDIIVSFFETQPPVLSGDAEQNRSLLEKLGSVRAECIGKIVVAAELVPEIIQVLQTAYHEYLTTRERPEDV